VSNIDMKQS